MLRKHDATASRTGSPPAMLKSMKQARLADQVAARRDDGHFGRVQAHRAFGTVEALLLELAQSIPCEPRELGLRELPD